MPEWDPEIDVDADGARALIDDQFPELRGAELTRIDAGWDNVVFLVDGRWTFRFPRRAIAMPGVEREIDVLGRLAGHLPLPIPIPRWIGTPTDAYPFPWFGAAYLPGVELAVAALPDDARVEPARALGDFLRALHAPSLARLVGTGLPVDPMRRADMALRVPFTRHRLAQAVAAGLWEPADAVEDLLVDAAALPPPPRTRVLHGDLHGRHVLIADGRAAGVIDWGDVCMGDPAVDLSIAFSAFSGAAREAFVSAYGPIGRLTALRARVIGAFLSAALLVYAADRGMDSLRAESRLALDRVVS